MTITVAGNTTAVTTTAAIGTTATTVMAIATDIATSVATTAATDTGLPALAAGFLGRYLNGRAASIFGGSHEVQRNIIAKSVLGL